VVETYCIHAFHIHGGPPVITDLLAGGADWGLDRGGILDQFEQLLVKVEAKLGEAPTSASLSGIGVCLSQVPTAYR